MVNLTVQAPKEVVDVLKAVDELVGKLVAKEPVGQLVVEELSLLVKLASEAPAIPEEVQKYEGECIDAGALYGRRMAYRLLNKPVVPVSVS